MRVSSALLDRSLDSGEGLAEDAAGVAREKHHQCPGPMLTGDPHPKPEVLPVRYDP